MNKDINTNSSEDNFIRQLFKNNFKPDDVPSDDFNRTVMDRVMSEWVSQSTYYEPIVDKRNRWWILPGVLTLFVTGFLFDVGQMSATGNEQLWLNSLSGAFQSLYAWIKPIHLLGIGASLAVGLLLMFDRLLQKLSNL